jgi:protein-S-isoprenylcysteine O-methyltransferase Ste14
MRPLPPILFLIVLGGMLALDFGWPAFSWIAMPWRLLGLLPIAIGVVLGLWSIVVFRRRGTPPHPGEGHAQVLVTEGPYRFTRNPMYVGLALSLLGAGILLGGVSLLIGPPLFVVGVDRLWIRREEGWPADAFGEDYAKYRAQVRPWM